MSAGTEIVRFDQVALPDISKRVSFTVRSGDMTVLVTPKDEAGSKVTRIIVGLDRPASGHVFLFGTDLSTLTGRELYDCRRRVGVSFKSGGLISNLKVWENLTLPLLYHTHQSQDEIRARGEHVLGQIGYNGELMALPGNLTVSQRKLIGTGRAMIMSPDVIVYEAPVSGLNQEEKQSFFRIAREFHRELHGRVTLMITSHRDVLSSVPEAIVIDLTEGQC